MKFVDLVSPLPVEQCCDHLRSAMDSRLAVFGGKPVIGHLSGTSLEARRRRRFKSSFQTRLFAELARSDRQTLIRCTFVNSKLSIVIVMTVFGMFPLFFGTGILTVVLTKFFHLFGIRDDLLSYVSFPLALVACVYLLVLVQRWISWKEQKFLVEFIRATLHADPVERSTMPRGQ